MCAAEKKETLKRKKKRTEKVGGGKNTKITRTKKCFIIVTYLRIFQGKRLKTTELAVSVDRTRDLQIFSLTLSQLSYPR